MWSAMMRLLAALALCWQLAQSLPSDLDQEDGEMSAMDAYRASLIKSPFSLSEQVFQMAEKRQAAKYCGKNLANALHLICKGKYNVPLYKKSDPQEPPYWLLPPSPLDDEPKFPFQRRSLASALMPVRQRRTRGVYDECCAKPCSIKEMSSYCSGR